MNVVAQFATIKAFLPHMIKMREGHIVSRALSAAALWLPLTSECRLL